MRKIQMVDLPGQYRKIKPEIDHALLNCLNDALFINGPEVQAFQKNLESYLRVKHVISCGNGTDALQISLMAMNLNPGDEIIVPSFGYAATAEVILLLGFKPVWIDIKGDFTMDPLAIEDAITRKTRAVIPVHLFGQCADMESIMEIARRYNLRVIEDAAQAIGAEYTFTDLRNAKAGTIGDFGCTSFFPSKNLGCYGDGGAIYTNNEFFAGAVRMIANHGQRKKYHHEVVGVNSRLDTIHAAVLNVKLKYLGEYTAARQNAATIYDELLTGISQIGLPERNPKSTHVFHQYTIKIEGEERDKLRSYLESNGIPTAIHYPVPLHCQKAYRSDSLKVGSFPVSEELSSAVLSLPMHTELDQESQTYIVSKIKSFYH